MSKGEAEGRWRKEHMFLLPLFLIDIIIVVSISLHRIILPLSSYSLCPLGSLLPLDPNSSYSRPARSYSKPARPLAPLAALTDALTPVTASKKAMEPV